MDKLVSINNTSIKKGNVLFRKFRSIFHLNTFQIILLGMFIAIYIILGIISTEIPFTWVTNTAANFLKFEFTDFLFLIAANFFNYFYLFLMIILCSFCRIPDGVAPVSNFFLILSANIIVIMFYIMTWSMKKFNKNIYIKNIFISLGVIILSSIVICIINKLFFIRLYVVFFPGFKYLVDKLVSPEVIWGVYLPFTLVNLSLNMLLYFSCIPAITALNKRYNLK